MTVPRNFIHDCSLKSKCRNSSEKIKVGGHVVMMVVVIG